MLSHDQGFLERLWKRLAPQKADRKCLHFTRISLNNTKICEWDIELATQDQYSVDRNALVNYYNTGEGNTRDIVKKLRPILETYCRNLYPGEFVDDTLGTIIGKVQAAGVTHHLFSLFDGLDLLNDYSGRYHHGENPNANNEPINDTELKGMVEKTINIIGSC